MIVGNDNDITRELWGMGRATVKVITDLSPRSGQLSWQLDTPVQGVSPPNPFALHVSGWAASRHFELAHAGLWHGSDEVVRMPLWGPDSRAIEHYRSRLSPLESLGFSARCLGHKAASRVRLARLLRLPGIARWVGPSLTACNFEGTVPLLPLPETATLRLDVVARNGTAYPLCELQTERPSVSIRQSASTSATMATMQPISVTAIGRTGSTWFLHLLSQHPRVWAIPKYPYETTVARNLMQAVVTAITNDCGGARIHADVIQALGSSLASDSEVPIQFLTQRFADSRVEQANCLLRCAAMFIGSCYRSIAHFSGKEPNASEGDLEYFVEKNLRPQRLFREVYPHAKELFLVRDFRDVICSSLAFNAKRGFAAFGRENVSSDREFVRYRAEMARAWVLEPWRERKGSSKVVKYETLIREPKACLRDVLEYLQLDSSDGIIDRMIDEAQRSQSQLNGHVTALDVSASIGRWVHDLSDDLRRECDEAFAEFDQEFGYAQ